MMTTVNIAYYEKKDWDYFLSIIDDRESMYDTWDDWLKAYLKTKTQLISEGFFVKEVSINMKELVDYCLEKKIKNDGRARSQFVITK